MSCTFSKKTSDTKVQIEQPARPAKIPHADDVKLTKYASGLGCACKLSQTDLEEALKCVTTRRFGSQTAPILSEDPNLLVGNDTRDDAAVYKISEDVGLVETLDFFPPIVDDAYTYGQIAAANSISDVYAMGGRPISALSIVGFPSHLLPMETLARIMQGAKDKAAEAGIVIAGGHTINDTEPKFGLSVTGIVHPKKIFENSNAKSGDFLILTKPIGTGVITSCMKKGIASDLNAKEAIESMTTLNKVASEVAVELGFRDGDASQRVVNACTDVTGFGLCGHLLSMARGSGMNAVIFEDQVPFMPSAIRLIDTHSQEAISGGTLSNFNFNSPSVKIDDRIKSETSLAAQHALLFDAQTNGGLLISVSGPKENAEKMVEMMHERGVKHAAIVGQMLGGVENAKDACVYVTRSDLTSVVPNDSAFSALSSILSQPAATVTTTTTTTTDSPIMAQIQHIPTTTGSNANVLEGKVLFIKEDVVGRGDEKAVELGQKLMGGFLTVISQQPQVPKQIICVNRGVFLTTDPSNEMVHAALKKLVERGVDVVSCGTCLLHHFGTADKLAIGRVVGADESIGVLLNAADVITI